MLDYKAEALLLHMAQDRPVRRSLKTEQGIVSLGVVVHITWEEKKQPFLNS
jgi:hypothetical protein